MTFLQNILTCRRILSVMVILSFIIHNMLRVNISIAIVDMVGKNHTVEGRFDWNEKEKQDILGSFYWGYIITSVPGGRMAEIYGTRIVLGTALLLASVITILTPSACYVDYYLVLATRVALGMALGTQWPSIPPMVTKWMSPLDNSKFISHMIASSLGVTLAWFISGYLISYLGWPSVFYVTGTTGLVWTFSWFYLVYDSPTEHPRISISEREKVEKETLKEGVCQGRRKVPWRNVLTSPPVWAIVMANGATALTVDFSFNELPTFMQEILHFDIEKNGLLSSIPYVARYVTAVVSCFMADSLRKGEKMSTEAIRKWFLCIAVWGAGILFVIQVFWGDRRAISVVTFSASLGFIGLTTAGHLSNSLDISPTYCGTIMGLANIIASIAGYASTKLVAALVTETHEISQWATVFWIVAGVDFIAGIFYLICASGELQNWNPKEDEHNQD